MAMPTDIEEGGFEAGIPEPEPDDAHPRLDAIRSWLVGGVQFVDRRRRFGGHGRARELLVAGRPAANGGSEPWHTLAAALHRYTVGGGLSELNPEERRVISLAYLEGRTNREIAALLGVSITTVRRRLWVALGRLDAYVSRGGAWLSAFVLAIAAYALSHAARPVRWVTAAGGSADRAQRVAATITAGAVAAAALGVVAFTSDSAAPRKSPHTVAAPAVAHTVVASHPSTPAISVPVTPPSIQPLVVAEGRSKTNSDSKTTSSTAGTEPNNGCDGNPTSAPPAVPVGPRAGHPTVAPVTHPDAGGCKG